MGASNVIAAYTKYAGKVPATSMQLLAYMAVVSKDSDREPWYGQGHEALAMFALGRPGPVRLADIRAVERALAPLAAAGAISTQRRAAVRHDGANTARYRLHLDPFDAPRIPVDVPPAPKPAATAAESTSTDEQDHARPTKSGAHVPRKVVARPTKSGRTSHEKRVTEETEETEERKEEEHPGVNADLTVSRARASPKCPRHPSFRGGTDNEGTLACVVCRHNPTLQVIQGGIA